MTAYEISKDVIKNLDSEDKRIAITYNKTRSLTETAKIIRKCYFCVRGKVQQWLEESEKY